RARSVRALRGSDVFVIGGQRIAVADIAHEIQARIGELIASPGDAVHVAVQAGEGGLQAIVEMILLFYSLCDGEMFMDRAIARLPVDHREQTTDVLARIHVILGKWLRG